MIGSLPLILKALSPNAQVYANDSFAASSDFQPPAGERLELVDSVEKLGLAVIA